MVEDLLEEHNDFRSEEMYKDEELRALMENVFGDSSDEEAL